MNGIHMLVLCLHLPALYAAEERAYEGKLASDWIRELEHHDVSFRLAAVRALKEIGVGGVRGLEKALRDPTPEVRQKAALALQAVGPEARAAVPALIRTRKHRDAETRSAAVEALARIGDASAVPALEAMLQDVDPRVRSRGLMALGEIGGDQVVPGST